MKVEPKIYRIVFCLTITLVVLLSAEPILSQGPVAPVLPQPILVYLGAEYYEANGKQYTRYRYTIDNLDRYPAELFAPSPTLPPCGTNTNSARTWVDFFDSRGRRLYGFCALASPQALNGIWFAIETDVVPPSWVYVELTDRSTNTKYRSNLTESTL
jgi:hypothetical protein